ncbi:uncharacterized protein TRAVEDRAFT_19701 [Trametes versicolor FP-101664 SS1]|uniref:uncharacterized protein n=1 Tax=Trametes versicolor (strain FP-101664) TaxID=717944 RepID=UPI00046234F8|nr:uncharacterized protein TRAVEDRAFT_19701 [Trametes versicolor FP-101664 SS1]EIW59218.1 hypothetical protein TRAVEDRAFT_19701 [Trametes versicolor FP-101664 SS1]
MSLTTSETGIVPSVERFVSTNDLLHHIRALGLLIVLTLFVSISAYILALHYGHPTEFSSSEPRVGFQADSGGRDSMDIISACASTLITCVYSSVHFDVPRSYAHRLSLRQKLVARDYWLELWVKATFWLLGIFSPEMLVLHAFFEYMIARRDVAWMREHGYAKWTIALAFAADMGALIPDGAKEGERPPHSGFALHGVLLRHHAPGALDCRALEHELADHTKADVLFKLLTTLQIARFFAGTVARWAVRLPIAPLETITCAYVACTLVYYGFWLQKPYNVNERVVVRVRPTPDAELTDQDPQPAAAAGEGSKWVRPLREFWKEFCVPFLEPPMTEKDRLDGSERMGQRSPYMTQGSLVTAAASVVVGLAHLACWDVEFPNSNGQVLWRYCSVLLLALPVAVFVIILGAAIIDRPRVTEVMNVMALSMIVVYCMARVVLLILLGHSFQSLPKGVYDTHSVPWLSFIPFIH